MIVEKENTDNSKQSILIAYLKRSWLKYVVCAIVLVICYSLFSGGYRYHKPASITIVGTVPKFERIALQWNSGNGYNEDERLAVHGSFDIQMPVDSIIIPSKTDTLCGSHIEEISEKDEGILKVVGWAYLKNIESRNSKIYLVVKSEKHTHIFPTVQNLRRDISIAYKEKTKYDNSGFKVKLSKQHLEEGRNEFYILITNPEGKGFSRADRNYEIGYLSDGGKELKFAKTVYMPQNIDKLLNNIEVVQDEKDWLLFRGWATIKNVPSKQTKTYIILQSESGSYRLPTTQQIRVDVSNAHGSRLYDYSGFVTDTAYKEGIKPGKYTVGLWMKNGAVTIQYFSSKVLDITVSGLSRPIPLTEVVPAPSTELMYNLETFNETKKFYSFSGWAYVKNRQSKNTKPYILLASESENYLLPANQTVRIDIPKAYNNDQRYLMSGFEAKVLKSTLPDLNYKIGVLLKNGGGQFLQFSNKVIKMRTVKDARFRGTYALPQIDIHSLKLQFESAYLNIDSVYVTIAENKILPSLRTEKSIEFFKIGDKTVESNNVLIVVQLIVSALMAWLCFVILSLKERYGVASWKNVPYYLFIKDKRWTFWVFFIVAIGVFSLWLLGQWPGIMSVDSLIPNFQEIRTLKFGNVKPWTYILYLLAIAQFADTPATVGFFQIILTSFVGASIFYYCLKIGAKWYLVLPFYLLFIASVPVGIYNITIWTDIPFTSIMVFWSFILFYLHHRKKLLITNYELPQSITNYRNQLRITNEESDAEAGEIVENNFEKEQISNTEYRMSNDEGDSNEEVLSNNKEQSSNPIPQTLNPIPYTQYPNSRPPPPDPRSLKLDIHQIGFMSLLFICLCTFRHNGIIFLVVIPTLILMFRLLNKRNLVQFFGISFTLYIIFKLLTPVMSPNNQVFEYFDALRKHYPLMSIYSSKTYYSPERPKDWEHLNHWMKLDEIKEHYTPLNQSDEGAFASQRWFALSDSDKAYLSYLFYARSAQNVHTVTGELLIKFMGTMGFSNNIYLFSNSLKDDKALQPWRPIETYGIKFAPKSETLQQKEDKILAETMDFTGEVPNSMIYFNVFPFFVLLLIVFFLYKWFPSSAMYSFLILYNLPFLFLTLVTIEWRFMYFIYLAGIFILPLVIAEHFGRKKKF
ncbi:MAG: hypothetical protein HW421_2768 [Ignavibacteria bacterium]|nr:hypothetical protein [Ignavibacteria bacterium]